eukprot:10860_1
MSVIDIDWSVDYVTLRKQLLLLSKPKLIKLCKSKKISHTGSKNEIVNRLAGKSTNQSVYSTDEEAIIHQLVTLGVANRQEIENAMQHVINRNDINEITDYIVNKQNKEEQKQIQNDLDVLDGGKQDKQINSNQIEPTQKVSSEDKKDEIKETDKVSKKYDGFGGLFGGMGMFGGLFGDETNPKDESKKMQSIRKDMRRIQYFNRDSFKDNNDKFHIKADAKLLSSIGFDEQMAQVALDVAGNDANKAIFLLIRYISRNGPLKEENMVIQDEKQYIDTFTANLTMEEANKVQCGDIIDHREKPGGIWDLVMISEKDGTNLNIHHFMFGNDTKYDVWSDYKKQLQCFSKAGSITNRTAHRLKHLQKGDIVDINPLSQQGGWLCGVIDNVDKASGQIDIKYYFNNEMEYYWTHCDNVLEVRSSTYEFEDLMRNHCYDGFINPEKDDFDTIKQKIQKCLNCIKTKIIPTYQSNMVNCYVDDLYYRFLQQFISIKLKKILNDDSKLNLLVEVFKNIYQEIVNEISIQKDTKHLQVERDLLTIDNNTKQAVNSWNDSHKKIIMTLKMKLHTINDSYIGKDEHKEYEEFVYNQHGDIINCGGNVSACIHLERINFVLELYQKYFILFVDTDKKNSQITFLDIFDELCTTDSYNVVQMINDFEHIKRNHMHQISNSSNSMITACSYPDKCICNTRVEEEQKENINDTYFGYSDAHHVNIMKYMTKIHMYLSHGLGLQLEPNDDNNTKSVKIRSLITVRHDKTHEYSKFVTEVNQEESTNPILQFGERFYYWKYFKDGVDNKGSHYIKRPDFENLKEELLNNKIYSLSMETWKRELLSATNHRHSHYGRSLKARSLGLDNQSMEIPVDLPISISHLLVILTYTNQTKLQYLFKKFGTRKNNKNDTIDTVKRFNKQIGNWYSMLMEVIRLFGDSINKNTKYWHGLSLMMIINSFKPLFCAPISTTTEFSVAHRFSGGTGIVICLRGINEEYGYFMDVSW